MNPFFFKSCVNFCFIFYCLSHVATSRYTRRLYSQRPLQLSKLNAASSRADSFAKVVTKGFQEYSFKETSEGIPFSQYPASEHRLTKYRIQSTDSKEVEVWVLPSEQQRWLLCDNTKQRESLFQRVLVRRMDAASVRREQDSMNQLLLGNSAIWIGLSGIGKSVASTVMLVNALSLLVSRHGGHGDGGDVGDGGDGGVLNAASSTEQATGLDEVFYRVGSQLHRFYWDDGALCGELVEDEGKRKQQIFKRFRSRRSATEQWTDVLLVEEDEDAALDDPEERGFYTGASRRALEQTFKTLQKTGELFFVVAPPSPTDLRVMFLAAAHFATAPLPLPSHLSSLASFDALRLRVGPVPRVLFSADERDVAAYLETRDKAAATKNPLSDLDERCISVSDTGESLKYFRRASWSWLGR